MVGNSTTWGIMLKDWSQRKFEDWCYTEKETEMECIYLVCVCVCVYHHIAMTDGKKNKMWKADFWGPRAADIYSLSRHYNDLELYNHCLFPKRFCFFALVTFIPTNWLSCVCISCLNYFSYNFKLTFFEIKFFDANNFHLTFKLRWINDFIIEPKENQ